MYVIYPADDLISLLITREYTTRSRSSGLSPVVPQTPPAPRDVNGNRSPQYQNPNSNLQPSSSTEQLDNQQYQFSPSTQHQDLSDIFSQQLRDQHNIHHHYESRESSLEKTFAADLKRVQLTSASATSSTGELLFGSSSQRVAQHQPRARSSTPVAVVDRSLSVTEERRVSRPFLKEDSIEANGSSAKNKPKRSVSFNTFDRKQSQQKQLEDPTLFGSKTALANGYSSAVTTSRLNLNRRVSPAPDLVETRQGFGSSSNINTSPSSNTGGSKSSSLIKKGKSWLPKISFSIQEEREEHPSAGATAATTQPTTSSVPSGPPTAPPEPADSFAEFLGKSYRGAATSSSFQKQQQQPTPTSSKGQRGVSPASASSATPTSGHQRFNFLTGGKSSSGVGSGLSGGVASGIGLGIGIASGMAGVNGGVSSIGSMLSLGMGHHGAGHLIAGQLVDANSLKDCVHPSLNESLKTHNSLSFKVIRIVSDFTQQLSQLHEQHAVQLQMLIENYRKRNAELRKERPPCNSSMFQIWETLLQEVEIDSQAHSDISASLARQVARPLLEKTFCLKIQSRKVFAHRESFETVLSKTEALLAKAYRDYSDACMQHIQMCSNQSLAQYYEAHNAYIQQLRGTNSMLKEYHSETLPALLQELEDVYVDLCKELSDSVMLGSEIIQTGSPETNRRYDQLAAICRNVNGIQDLRDFVKTMVVPAGTTPRHAFTLPLPLLTAAAGSEEYANQDLSHVPVLKDELIMDRLVTNSIRNRIEGLKKEMAELEAETRPIQDSLDTLVRMQQRSLDSNLYNKANELQEEISMKRFDLRVAQMQIAALRAQRELFGPIAKSEMSSSGMKGGKIPGGDAASMAGEDQSTGSGGSGGKNSDRKMSAATAQTMKSKWLKAFKSLKTAPSNSSGAAKEVEK
ncbi:unnamed protein product [Orchesella dallaii]